MRIHITVSFSGLETVCSDLPQRIQPKLPVEVWLVNQAMSKSTMHRKVNRAGIMLDCCVFGLSLLVLFDCPGLQLKRVDATFSSQLLLQDGVDHAMSSRLHLRLERIRCNIHSTPDSQV